MMRINPEWLHSIQSMVNPSPYFNLQSMEIKELTPGASRLEIILGKKHLQPFGIVHGGVYSTLVDAAGFWACYSLLEPGLGLTTVEMKLNYLAPAKGGRLIGLGRCIKQGRNLSLADANIEDAEGRLLAHGTVTLMALHDLPLGGQEEFPRKFLD
jgi:uncharacterized protein (TIGR00369 family)